MKKRLLAFLLAVCIVCTALVAPVSAGGTTAAVQAALARGGLSADEAASLDAPLTRAGLARLLTAFSTQSGASGATGRLFSDVDGSAADAAAIRTAVRQGWMSGYADGSFRPGNAVTLEEGCTAVLKLLGYDAAGLGGSFPAAQLDKASSLGLRSGIACVQGQALTRGDGAALVYNALTATAAGGTVYAQTLGLAVVDGQVDLAAVLRGGMKGPFIVPASGAALPFTPAAVYRNGAASDDAALAPYDVYYINESARTVWIYTRRAAGRVTAVAPSASAPTSVTVAGVEYTIGSASVTAALSAFSGGGVGQVVTLLLGVDDAAVGVLTDEAADAAYYGVVQASARALTAENGPAVRQMVSVACTDGVTRTVYVDKGLSFPAGWLVRLTVGRDGEQLEAIGSQSLSGTVNAAATALGDIALAQDVEILDTAAQSMAGAVRPARLAGVTLAQGDVRYYTTNSAGEIDRLILDDVTGDLWQYGALDTVRGAADAIGSAVDDAIEAAAKPAGSSAGGSASGQKTSTAVQAAVELKQTVLPSTSDVLYGLVDGSIASTLWAKLSSSGDELVGYVLRQTGRATGGALGSVLQSLGSGAAYTCYVDGTPTVYQSSVKFPVVAGGVAIATGTDGTVNAMRQLVPVRLERLGPDWAEGNGERYALADVPQVFLWSGGQYFPTTLAKLDTGSCTLIGWYDSFGCTAGHRIRVLVAVPIARQEISAT